MQPAQLKGTLVRWDDDRGFGFIAPDDGGSRIFLHIHAIRNASRRPQIGDTLLFGIETQADGRIRATNAFIQGLSLLPSAPTPRYTANRQPRNAGFPAWMMLLIVALGSVSMYFRPQSRTETPTYNKAPQFQNDALTQPSTPKAQKTAPTTPPQVRTTPKAVVAKPASTTPHFITEKPYLETEKPPSVVEEPEHGNIEELTSSSEIGSGPIKGNISINTGAKLYHVPGMRDYDITLINRPGERYFQTEEEALAAGWQRAPR